MAQTKSRSKQQRVEPAPAGQPVPEGAPADDRTAIDDLEAKKKRKEKLPKGFKRRLPGGVTRRVRVNKEEIGKPAGKPYRVTEPDGTATDYDELEIEGPSRMRRTAPVLGEGDTVIVPAGVALETDAPILVGAGRRVLARTPCVPATPS